ncbi:MAG TPA: ATP-binding protein [Acidimicrobiia bacterium]|nr:ATP-binding protein [Acidimicrobiia bacterium]
MTTPVIYCWSSGKDSAFGLWTLLEDPAFEVRALLTTLAEKSRNVSMSGVREELLELQARALRLPLFKVWLPLSCPDEVYEERMERALASEPLREIRHMAFSDLYLAEVRAYREERLAQAGKEGLFPLWGRDTTALAREIVSGGFRATVVCVDSRVLPTSLAGEAFDYQLLERLPDGVDPCGERGEFHTFVWDAPMYQAPIACRTGEVWTRDSFIYCDVLPVVRADNGIGRRKPDSYERRSL